MGNNTPNIPPLNRSESPSDDNRAPYQYQSPPSRHEYGDRSWKLPGSAAVSSTVRVGAQEAEQLSFEFEEPATATEIPIVDTPIKSDESTMDRFLQRQRERYGTGSEYAKRQREADESSDRANP